MDGAGPLSAVFGAAFTCGAIADDGVEIFSYRSAAWLWLDSAAYFLG